MQYRRIREIPELIRFLALHALLGVLLGCGLAAGLLITDAAGIGTLLLESDAWLAAGFIYFGSFAVTFGSAVMGTAVMLLPREDS